MAAILRFFIRFAPLIYLLLVLGLLFGFRRLVQARADLHEAVYGLERELAHRRTYQAITALVLVGLLGLAQVVLVAFLAPNVPALSLLATPTLNLLAVPTTTLAVSLPGAGTPEATAVVVTSGCIPGQISITAPKPGDQLRGEIILEGTADVPNFGFYKYEFSPLGANQWSTIQASRDPKRDTELGRWDASTITPGDYELRLVVTDNQGEPLPACVVPIRILQP